MLLATFTRCQTWNDARSYHSIMPVVTWLNAASYYAFFHRNETLECVCFSNLKWVRESCWTSFYDPHVTSPVTAVVFSTADFAPKYSRRAKVVTIVCWTIVSLSAIYHIIMICIYAQLDDPALLFFTETYPISRNADITKVVCVVVYLEFLIAGASSSGYNTNLVYCSQCHVEKT